MNTQTQKELAALTNAFYRAEAESFSDTRHAAWAGWNRCTTCISDYCKDSKLTVLDVGCGNMRFERYLIEALPQRAFEFKTIDNCHALIPEELPATAIKHHEVDIVSALIDGKEPWPQETALIDIACSFGVMHHVPSEENRIAFLKALINSVRLGGLVVVSLWHFMDVPSLATKAQDTLRFAKEDKALPENLRAQLDALAMQDDYLLGWQNKLGIYRYCHSFTSQDANTLVAQVAPDAKLIDRFRSDGRSGDANEYLVLQRVS